MPDVGVLNLQIHDNSTTAAEGLDRLAAKLEAIKQAASGSRLATVANGIKRINAELKSLQPSAILKLKQLADVMERLGSASGNVGGIRISFGGKGQSAEEINASMQAAREAAAQTSSMFESIGQRIQEDVAGVRGFTGEVEKLNNLVQQTGWTAQSTAEQFSQMFQVMNSIRMSGALGGGESPFALGDGTGGSGADWTYWKDGAIEVEGYVDDISTSMNRLEGSVDGVSAKLYSSTSESVGSAMEQIKMLAMQYEAEIGRLFGLMFDETGATRVGADIEGLSRQIDDYDNRISELAEKYKELESISEMSDMAEPFAQTSEAVDEVRESFERTTSAVQDYDEAIEFARQWNAAGVTGKGTYNGEESADIQYVNNLIQTASQADLLAMRIDALRDKLYQMASSCKASGDQIARMVSQIQTLQGKLDAASGSAGGVRQSLSEIMIGSNGLNGALKRMFPTISGLAKRFGQLVKYRMLRAVIRQIAEGFREGMENYYRYSEAVGGSFAPAMDSAASALLQMKNSIGAAVAPVIQALIPLLNQVVSVFITLINYVNQFFALLRGQTTWTQAVQQTTQAYENQTNAANNAAKAAKDLLADWDELNIIQSQDTGGGGGGGGGQNLPDYSQMFQEVHEYAEWIKSLSDILKNTFGDVLEAAKLIGLAILGWKVSRAFNGILGKLGKIAAGIALEIIGVKIAYNSGMDAGANGWNMGNIIGAVGGTLATAIGGSLITSAIGLSSGVGFAIGIGVGLVATLYGYIQGKSRAADAVKWGNLHMTAEEVREYVQSQFSFDVTAEIDALHTSITDMEGAKAEADAKITEFEKTLKEAKVNIDLGVDADPEGTTVQNALTRAQEAIKSVQGLIESTNTGIEIGLKYMPMTDSDGKDVSEQFLDSVEVAETPLKDYLRGLGKDMAKAMYEGEIAGWDEGTTQAAIELMEKQKRIFDRAKELENDRKLSSSVNDSFAGVVKDGVIDRETAEASYAEQIKLLDDWSTAAREQANEYADNLKGLADLAQAAAEEEEKLGRTDVAAGLYQSANDLRAKAQERLDQVEKDIDAKLKETKEKIGDRWIEVLSTVYGADVGNKVREMIAHTQYGDGGYYFGYVLDELFAGGHETAFGKVLKQGGTAEEIAKNLEILLQSAYLDLGNQPFSITYQGPSFVDEILDEFVGNPLDLMDSGAKEELKQALIDYFGDESFGTDVYNHLFDIHTEVPVEIEPVPEIVGAETAESFDFDAEVGVVDVPVEFSISTEEQQALREAIESAMSDGVMDISEEMDLMVRYGWSNYENMLKELQYNLDEEGRNRGMMNRPIGMIASAGVSDVGNGRPDLYRPVVTPEPEDDQRQVNNTATGVEKGVGNLYDALQSILRVAEAINRKEFKVSVVPDSSWGGHNARSQEAYDRARG